MISILSDILFSLRLTRWLEFMAIIVVIFLASSPGIAFTAIGLSAKLGLIKHATRKEGEE
ncbi:MAG: hypothetical protein H6510_10400 [Acidobacteria bacterium]|nr:hypothetical protein [Acidobacteriota bacterium]MCB9398219.1 hypothetical protein [Acidobacteriota bacterium]